jgi:LPXTG-motif cell wall-anchored protein
LSALVEVPVQTQVAASPPVPTLDAATVAQLPRTGASHLKEMMLLGFGSILLGSVLLLGRRRLGAR